MRPLDRLVRRFVSTLYAARAARVRAVTLVGGGAAGVELALGMAHRLIAELGSDAPHVRVITDAPAIVPEFPPAAFFFSSRRRHTRFDCDWSSDVCSSD